MAAMLVTWTCFALSFTFGTSDDLSAKGNKSVQPVPSINNVDELDKLIKQQTSSVENDQYVKKQVGLLSQKMEIMNHKLTKCDKEFDKLKINMVSWKKKVEERFHHLENEIEGLKVPQNKQVVFHAHLTRVKKTRSAKILVFNKLITNIGAGYDSSTGQFTAPSNGTYYFVCTFLKSAWTAPFYIDMRHNDVQISLGYAPPTGHREPGSMNAAVYMAKDDVMYVRTEWQYRLLSWAFFSGYQIK